MILNDPKTFSVDIKGSVTKTNYSGVFKVRPLLSHRDKLRRDEMKRQLIGGFPDSTSVSAMRIAEIFSKIWAHTVDAPSWWKDSGNGIDLLEDDPVEEVINKILEIEREALGIVEEEGEKAKKELTEMAKKQG